MKTLTFLLGAVLIAVSCSKPAPEVKGAYKMLSQNIKGDTSDQTYTNPQLKIYTDQHMMYTNFNPEDSSTSFGISTYVVNNDGVLETSIYAAADTATDDAVYNFTLLIEKNDKGFKQVINDMTAASGEKFKLTEDYETVSTDKTSPLDGAWILTSASRVNEKGETAQAPATLKQYKVHYAGNVMWGHTWLDSLNVSHAGIGSGTFEMNGENASREVMTISTYPEAVGTFELALKFNGPDEYTQTITGVTPNTSQTETYKRLVK